VSKTLLSVCLITYNHAKYIREAIDGVLMQKVNFTWELIIADDFSTDGTREIVLEYKDKYPAFIKLILQEKNVGAAQNCMDLMAAPSSKYIAYLEGDDYWTDPLKLQKQVDFLDTHSECTGCFHDVVNVDKDNKIIKENYYAPTQQYYNQKDAITILLSSYATCSLVFRTSVLTNMPELYSNNLSDYFLDLLITEYGLLAYIPQNMGAYRIHPGGIWQGNRSLANLREYLSRIVVLYKDRKFVSLYRKELEEKMDFICNEIALPTLKNNVRLDKVLGYFPLSEIIICAANEVVSRLIKKVKRMFSV
jgi:glycosyltransferase involved in cell wall biosynthesis